MYKNPRHLRHYLFLYRRYCARDIFFTVDGQEPFAIKGGDVISVVLNKKKAKLVAGSAEKFYNALRSKLNWSGVPHA